MAHARGTTVRVATYNVYLGADLSLVLGEGEPGEVDRRRGEVVRQLTATAFPHRVEAVARVLARCRPDLVGLQEVTRWQADGEVLWDHLRLLLSALEAQGEPYDAVVAQPNFHGEERVALPGMFAGPRLVRVESSDVVLVRTASAVTVRQARVGSFDRILKRARAGVGEVGIGRGWCAVDVEVDGAPLRFVSTHTEAYDTGTREAQQAQLVAAESDVTGALVVVGDLNAPPEKLELPSGFLDAWVAAGRGADGSATCCQAGDLRNEVSSLDQRIDHIWVRSARVRAALRAGAQAADRNSEGLWPSDHACVVADLEVTGEEE